MDWQEKYIDKLDRDIDEVKNTITASEERISRMIESSLTEIRDRDNQRQQDMNQIRSIIDSIMIGIEHLILLLYLDSFNGCIIHSRNLNKIKSRARITDPAFLILSQLLCLLLHVCLPDFMRWPGLSHSS